MICHTCDTTIPRIVIHYKARCNALYLFNLVDLTMYFIDVIFPTEMTVNNDSQVFGR